MSGHLDLRRLLDSSFPQASTGTTHVKPCDHFPLMNAERRRRISEGQLRRWANRVTDGSYKGLKYHSREEADAAKVAHKKAWQQRYGRRKASNVVAFVPSRPTDVRASVYLKPKGSYALGLLYASQ